MNQVPSITESKPLIVGIGASAGGLDAIQDFFNHIPGETGMSFVIIQHLSPNFKSLMNELLGKHTGMEILTVTEEMEIQPNKIYLNRSDVNISLKGNKIKLIKKAPFDRLNLPIDIFFHSLGSECAERSVAIVLSGTGSDGSRGIRTVKASGGTVMVQDPQTAQFNGMPNTALHTHLADFIGSPIDLAKKLIDLSTSKTDFFDSDKIDTDILFKDLLSEVHKITGIDFRTYKSNTLARRIQKRMDILGIIRLDDYKKYFTSNEDEAIILYKEFMIGVTNFFRDPEAFDSLVLNGFGKIFNDKKSTDPIRIWIPACSTGEEVFTIAILLDEYLIRNKINRDYKIFATDIDTDALRRASAALYPVNIITDIAKERLQNYFVKSGDQFQLIKRIREKVIFSAHNLVKDPPFIRMDIISCRNLLIYLKPETQKRVISNFHFSLRSGGILLLGHSENISDNEGQFEVLDPKWRIYKRSGQQISRNNIDDYDFKKSVFYKYLSPDKTYASNAKNNSHSEESYYRTLTELHSPPSIFIDQNFQIMFINGDIGKYLTVGKGVFTSNLIDMLEPGLSSIVRNAVRRAAADKIPVEIKDATFTHNDNNYTVSIIVRIPFIEVDNYSVFLIEFPSIQSTDTIKITMNLGNDTDINNQRITDLESELKVLNTEKQNIVEELETSNEELQASNEELMASNEELQSANEELQSVNEELYSINTELQAKNTELENLTLDMENLLASTQIGTLFLDSEMRIRKFTPELRKVFNLRENDIGRPIYDFASNFADITEKDILVEAKKVIEERSYSYKQIKSTGSRHYLQRITPFTRSDESADGVVITYIDITDLRDTVDKLEVANTVLDQAFESAGVSWWIWDILDPKEMGNRFGKFFNWLPFNSGIINVNDYKEYIHPEDLDGFVEELNKGISNPNTVFNYEYRIKSNDGRWRWLQERAVVKINTDHIPYIQLVGVSYDINDSKVKETKLSESEIKYRTMFETMQQGVIYLDPNGYIISANPKAEEILGLTVEQMQKRNSMDSGWKAVHEDMSEFAGNDHPSMIALKTGKPASGVIMGVFNPKINNYRWIIINAIPQFRGNEKKPYQVYTTFEDITSIRNTKEILSHSLREKEILLKEIHHRVKNNLQIISSLLSLQTENISDAKTRTILETAKNRIHSISVIHKHLYESDDLSQIDFKHYLKTIISIFNSSLSEDRIKTEIKGENLLLDINTAVPASLIIHELVSNSVKHAFKSREKGKISVTVKSKESLAEITVKDNGKGLPKNFDTKKAKSLGMNLILNLVSQLNGNLIIENGNGATFKIQFPINEEQSN